MTMKELSVGTQADLLKDDFLRVKNTQKPSLIMK